MQTNNKRTRYLICVSGDTEESLEHFVLLIRAYTKVTIDKLLIFVDQRTTNAWIYITLTENSETFTRGFFVGGHAGAIYAKKSNLKIEERVNSKLVDDKLAFLCKSAYIIPKDEASKQFQQEVLGHDNNNNQHKGKKPVFGITHEPKQQDKQSEADHQMEQLEPLQSEEPIPTTQQQQTQPIKSAEQDQEMEHVEQIKQNKEVEHVDQQQPIEKEIVVHEQAKEGLDQQTNQNLEMDQVEQYQEQKAQQEQIQREVLLTTSAPSFAVSASDLDPAETPSVPVLIPSHNIPVSNKNESIVDVDMPYNYNNYKNVGGTYIRVKPTHFTSSRVLDFEFMHMLQSHEVTSAKEYLQLKEKQGVIQYTLAVKRFASLKRIEDVFNKTGGPSFVQPKQ